MRKLISRFLLKLLNSHWLNNSPCQYGFIGNVDAFSYSHLRSEENQRPGITVKTILDEADQFRTCPMNKDGVTVIDNGEIRPATVFDIRDLKELGKR